MHEASLYEENCFVTLTYDEEHVPPLGGLDRAAFPKFMKRLRKAIAPRKVRFFHAGEYGSRTGRPHYHACLFGYDFPDKREWTRRGGFPVWRSEALERLWSVGLSELGSVSFESAAYVARYIMKKVNGEAAADHYVRVDGATGEVASVSPEYTTMSRRPGIGRPWLDRYLCEVYPADGVVVRGRLMKPPRFFDRELEARMPEMFQRVVDARKAKRDRANETEARLGVRGKVAQARLDLHARSLE